MKNPTMLEYLRAIGDIILYLSIGLAGIGCITLSFVLALKFITGASL